MSETVRIRLDSEAFQQDLDAIRDEMARLVEEDLNPLAENVEKVFRGIGRSITDELGSAAERGRISIRGLVNSVLEDLTRLAADSLIRQPLEGALGQIFGGSRAGGGAVTAGQAYLVGEHGPELFVPGANGQIGTGRAPINVTVNMTGPASGTGTRRSDTQIAAGIQRALSKAMRNA